MAQAFFSPKRDHLKHRQKNTSSRATLNETFTAKYNGVLPRTPYVRPKSEIYTPKRDKHSRPFNIRVPPPPLPPGGGKLLT